MSEFPVTEQRSFSVGGAPPRNRKRPWVEPTLTERSIGVILASWFEGKTEEARIKRALRWLDMRDWRSPVHWSERLP